MARNLALHGVQSFWSTEPTNGVHPLWLYLLAAFDWLVARVSIEALWHPAFAVPLSAALLSVGAICLNRVAERAKLSAALFVFGPVAYLAFFGVLYSEVHTAFCAFGLLLWVVCREDEDGRARPLAVGLAAAALLLARLDTVFFVGAFTLWYAARHRSSLRLVRLMVLVLAVPVLVYAASNIIWFGGAVPVSGYLKSTFPTPSFAGMWRHSGSLMLMLGGYSLPFGWLPIAFGAVVVIIHRRRLTGLDSLLLPLLAGAAGHAVYTGFFTVGFTFWYWYYLLPVMLGAWSLALLTRGWCAPRAEVMLRWSVVGLLAVALTLWRGPAPTEARFHGLATLRVVRSLGIDHATLFVSEWPGTVAFFTHNQVIAADMLTSNRPLVDRIVHAQNGAQELLDQARRRGTPVDYVVFNGGLFLRPDPLLRTLEYTDPRMAGNRLRAAIGVLPVATPLLAADDAIVWALHPTDLPTSSR